jgi:3-dehydroquinate synthase
MLVMNLSQLNQIVKSEEFFIIDKNISDLYPQLSKELVNKKTYYIDNAELSKSFEVLEDGCRFFLEAGIKRGDCLHIIGGGATTDLGGFIASCLLRGISWHAYPTSLLAMVDAAIGGKVGINTSHGKNLVGSFHLPSSVNYCEEFLHTLPKKEFDSGMGEIIKYLFLSRSINEIFNSDSFDINSDLMTLITACADYKEEIVEEDFQEAGKRKILNLGHTFGHAIEKSLQISHGKAVAIGLGIIIDIYKPEFKNNYQAIVKKMRLDLSIPKINYEQFWSYLKFDKKITTNKSIELIIPTSKNNTEIRNVLFDDIDRDLKAYEKYKSFFK